MIRFAANLDFLFTERPFLERFAVAADAGFDGVEILFPYAHDTDAIAAALARSGLALALLNTPAGDWTAGERGRAAVPGAEAAFAEDVAGALALTARLRPDRLHVLAGIARGARARAVYLENLASAAAAAATAGGPMLTIEPINARDMPGYHLATLEEAEEVLAALGRANVGLQLDLYHAQISGGDLTRRIERLAPSIAHVQIASVPDRGEPDGGETRLSHLLATLIGAGYRGWIAAEYRPRGRTEAGLGWLAAARAAIG